MPIYYGTNKVKPSGIKSVYFGNNQVYSGGSIQQLTAPTISLFDYDFLNIKDNDGRTETYDIYVDNVLQTNIPIILDTYNITTNLEFMTADSSNVESLIERERDSATLTFYSEDGFTMPESIEVSGCDYVYTRTSTTQGTIYIYNAVSDISIGIYGYGYKFTISGTNYKNIIASQKYDGVITFPATYSGVQMTEINLSQKISETLPLISKIVIENGITTLTNSSNIFSATKEYNMILPSSITTVSKPFIQNITNIGITGGLEYGWETEIPVNGLSFNNAGKETTIDIKSTITNIGNYGLYNSNTSNNQTTNIYFRQPNSLTVTFGTNILYTGASKAVQTYNIYTDNESCKTAMENYAGQYATINMFHLDGTEWSA